jgi:hypothetical protein
VFQRCSSSAISILATPYVLPVKANSKTLYIHIYFGWVFQSVSCQVLTTEAHAASQGSPAGCIVDQVVGTETDFLRALGFYPVLSHQCSVQIRIHLSWMLYSSDTYTIPIQPTKTKVNSPKKTSWLESTQITIAINSTSNTPNITNYSCHRPTTRQNNTFNLHVHYCYNLQT